MKCPYCGTGLHTKSAWSCFTFSSPGEVSSGSRAIGYEVAARTCPECENISILLKSGVGKSRKTPRGYPAFELKRVEGTELLFPKHPHTFISSEIPESYGREFMEASSVLSISPKASAALSRRLLQTILREEYGIKKKSLSQEIDVFVERRDVPSDLASSVDAIRNVGNFAVHPVKSTETGSIVEVENGEAEWVLETVERLLDLTFVRPAQFEVHKQKLNEKLESAGKPPIEDYKEE